jgi:hypothetical protein
MSPSCEGLTFRVSYERPGPSHRGESRPGPLGHHFIVDAQPTPPDYAEADFSSKSVTWREPSQAPRRACAAMTQPWPRGIRTERTPCATGSDIIR